MKKFLMWAGVAVGILADIVALTLVITTLAANARLKKIYVIPDESVSIPTDQASIELGERIFQYRGCKGCHGERLEGKVYLDDPAVGKVISTNLTTGKGGVGSDMSDADWVRAIRHGIRNDGTGLLFMPSTEFYYLSDADIGAIIAYMKSVPPTDSEVPPSQISPIGKVVMALVKGITFIPAEMIPHNAPRPTPPEAGITPEYGAYLALSCHVCHGSTMSGGAIPGFPSSWPPAPNLTLGSGSMLTSWDEQGFISTMRTGFTPDKKVASWEYMPWLSYRSMTDDELKAVWVYLQSLPKLDYGNR